MADHVKMTAEVKQQLARLHTMISKMLASRNMLQRNKAGNEMVVFLINLYRRKAMNMQWTPEYIHTMLLEHYSPDSRAHEPVIPQPLPYDAGNVLEHDNWRSRMLPLGADDMDYDRNMGNVFYWLYAAYCLGMHMQESGFGFYSKPVKAHYAVDVQGDGSCFYQCLSYGMMWYLPDAGDSPSSVWKMKLHIIDVLFGIDLFEQAQSYNARKRVLPWCKDTVDRILKKVGARDHRSLRAIFKEDEFDISVAANKLGLHKTQRGRWTTSAESDKEREMWVSHTQQYGDELSIELGSLCFNVQIIVYGCESRESKTATLAHVSMDFDGLVTDWGTPTARYAGKPVIILLRVGEGASAHFNLLSRFPLLNGMNENGIGNEDELVPHEIEVFPLGEDLGTEPGHYDGKMPAIQRCMACRRWIVDH